MLKNGKIDVCVTSTVLISNGEASGAAHAWGSAPHREDRNPLPNALGTY